MKNSYAKGSPDQFLAKLKNKIADLGGDVEASSSVKAASEVDADYEGRYVHQLIGDVEEKLIDAIDGAEWSTDQSSIICLVTNDGDTFELNIPKADLTMDLKQTEKDADYIADAILGLCKKSVQGATNTSGIACKPAYTKVLGAEDDSAYTLISRKEVYDTDDFLTDYSWYQAPDGTYVFVLGDSELYGPEDEYFDYECDAYDEAKEWFDSYTGENDVN